ncbi:MAG TPA: serine/threonine-protein kinase [Terriglobales bacterium]|nr:serine/threonine-protein kinase [Terriglobales bacterium]
MPRCRSCNSEIAITGRFCSACGAPVGSDEATLTALTDGDETIAAPGEAEETVAARTGSNEMPIIDAGHGDSPRARRPSSASSSRPPSSAAFALNEGRFLPGRLIASRYRIIALLGKGGMGEVYRADDLTLGQPVALKFLPEEASLDESLLERFRNEVRIARRVSHPNVCRVYDVGEVDGNTFFTMEYIDGEDLASLLRRIGRLPQDKAVDIARQLCAGLAAAHAKGVLHRDLKPANIMLDGRGQVVITDFGLAGLADAVRGEEIRSGTPAYMAPEQLTGREVTAQSDIYSLGLVLYEIFTGKRAFTAEALAALVRGGETSTPSKPSSVVKDLDPAIEKVILRCLEPEPRMRPKSALSVAGGLPGGDPLAAALAAGETPSPEMVAAAGEISGLPRRIAVCCLAVILLGLIGAVVLTIRHSALDQMGVELSPEVLTQKAHEIIARFGYGGKAADSFYDFEYASDFTSYVETHDKSRSNWDQILQGRPSLLNFWYRQSPEPLTGWQFHNFPLMTPGMVTQNDPPPTTSGMILAELDYKGRLVNFEAMPAEVFTPSTTSSAFDWNMLFAAAELDPAQFQPAQPTWNSLASFDARAAWTGKWPGTDRALRIEAAGFQGKPVFFRLISDWTEPPRMQGKPDSPAQKAAQVTGLVVAVAGLLTMIWFARRHYRQGRGDRQGSMLLAKVVFGLMILLWLFRSHLTAGFDVLLSMLLAISTGLLISGLTYTMYLALEPAVRRHFPRAIISWSRLLTGRVRDALVGRDVLFGVTLGVVWIVILKASGFILRRMGGAPDLTNSDLLLDTRRAFGAWLGMFPTLVLGTLQFFGIFLGAKALFKKDWLATIIVVAFFVGIRLPGSSHLVISGITLAIVYLILALIVYRFGLVALACSLYTADLIDNVSFTGDISAWYFGMTVFCLVSVIALAGWGFYYSLGPTADEA